MHPAAAINHDTVAVGLDVDLAILQSERMAKRNQFMRSFRCHDTRNDGRRKYGSFFRRDLVVAQFRNHRVRQFHDRPGVRLAIRSSLVPDVHHGRLIAFVDMTEFCHRPVFRYPPMRYISTLLNAWCSATSGLRSSLYRSARCSQMRERMSASSSSSAPFRIGSRKSVPCVANRQV